jgi:ribosomal protein S8E
MITQTVIYQCSVNGCGNEYVRKTIITPGAVLETTYPPDGWRIVEGILICDKHEVEIIIKPKEANR